MPSSVNGGYSTWTWSLQEKLESAGFAELNGEGYFVKTDDWSNGIGDNVTYLGGGAITAYITGPIVLTEGALLATAACSTTVHPFPLLSTS